MIRESNTLTWQETAEQKKDDAKKRKSAETKKKGVANPRAAAVT